MFLDKWLGRASGFYGLWPILPPSLVAALSAYLSTGVGWINAYGAWGWFASGLVAFVMTSVALALTSRSKLWRVQAQERARIIGDSSPFDPMARVYEGKRIYLRDLAPLGRRQVVDKRFIDCEIIGPGTAIIGLRSAENKPWPTMKDCHTVDVDCVEMDPEKFSQLAITLLDCDFDGCRFYHMTLLFFRRDNDSLNWITPDFNQPRLIEDNSVGPQQG